MQKISPLKRRRVFVLDKGLDKGDSMTILLAVQSHGCQPRDRSRGGGYTIGRYSQTPFTPEVTLANVQKFLEEFHDRIKLRRFGEEKTLREKRDILRKKLKERLPEIFSAAGEVCPSFSFQDQGSYELGTGVKPLDSDFDIDQGLYFEVAAEDIIDPVTLKLRVRDALEGHTKSVEIRRKCVTVQYQENDEPLYHVDLAVYSDRASNTDQVSRLACGKEYSDEEHRFWELSELENLADTIWAKFPGSNGAQFCRVVRYLKRWKDQTFSNAGNGAPTGIGLTIACYDQLTPAFFDPFSGKADDLSALRGLVRATLDRFQPVWDEEEQRTVYRISVFLPVQPLTDLFARMTNKQMATLKVDLRRLLVALDSAAAAVDPVDACQALQEVFGEDFEIPPKEETALRVHAPIASHTHAA